MPALFLLSLLVSPALLAEAVDWIVTARHILPMSAEGAVIDDGAVAVRGSTIVAVGPRAGVEKRFQARHSVNRPEALIAPGLINTHTHAAMSLFRGMADDLRLQEWLEKYIFPAEAKNVDPEFVRWGTRLACLEMLLGGTTTYADMYYFEEVVAQATKEAGMRGVLGQTIIRFPVPDARSPEEGLARTENFLKQFQKDELIVPAVAPHAFYTNKTETLIAARALADRYGAPLLFHLAETKREVEETIARDSASPVKVLDKLGLLRGRTLAAHAVWLDDEDLRILGGRGVGIAHCPSSNMKLASGVAPVTKMLSLGLRTGLGTDGPAGSNNDFNLFEEMDLAGKLQKVSTGDPQALPASKALAMATIGGARALGMEKEIGTLEVGKKADLILIRLDAAHAVPVYNLYSQMVYALKASDVIDVMVNGRWVVRDGRALTLNASEIRRKAVEYQQRIRLSLAQ